MLSSGLAFTFFFALFQCVFLSSLSLFFLLLYNAQYNLLFDVKNIRKGEKEREREKKKGKDEIIDDENVCLIVHLSCCTSLFCLLIQRVYAFAFLLLFLLLPLPTLAGHNDQCIYSSALLKTSEEKKIVSPLSGENFILSPSLTYE